MPFGVLYDASEPDGSCLPRKKSGNALLESEAIDVREATLDSLDVERSNTRVTTCPSRVGDPPSLVDGDNATFDVEDGNI